MLRWRAKNNTYGNDAGGVHFPIVKGVIVLTHTDPGIKEFVNFVPEGNPRLQLMLHGDQFKRDFEVA